MPSHNIAENMQCLAYIYCLRFLFHHQKAPSATIWAASVLCSVDTERQCQSLSIRAVWKADAQNILEKSL